MKTNIDWARFIQLQPSFLYDEIFVNNEYQLIEDEVNDRVVFDVGANVGIFTAKCLTFGAKQVFAVEAQPSIFKWGLEFNMRLYPQVKTINRAVLLNDYTEVFISNNFIASHLDLSGEPVKTICLQTLFTESNSEDLILKMDIEGAEYESILTTSDEVIKRCKFIHIELHPHRFGLDSIRQKFFNCGFYQTHSAPAGDGCYVDKWVRT